MSEFGIDFKGAPVHAVQYCYIELVDATGAPYDWTGSAFETRIAKSRGAPALVTLRQADGDVVPSIVGGRSRITWRFRPAVMGGLQPGNYVHSTIRTLSGEPLDFGSGTVVVTDGVRP